MPSSPHFAAGSRTNFFMGFGTKGSKDALNVAPTRSAFAAKCKENICAFATDALTPMEETHGQNSPNGP